MALAQISATNVVENPKTISKTVKGITFDAHVTTNTKPCWRVLSDTKGSLLYVPWYDSGSPTETRHNVATCPTLDAAKKYILDKKLKVSPEQQAEIDAMKEETAVKVEVPK